MFRNKTICVFMFVSISIVLMSIADGCDVDRGSFQRFSIVILNDWFYICIS